MSRKIAILNTEERTQIEVMRTRSKTMMIHRKAFMGRMSQLNLKEIFREMTQQNCSELKICITKPKYDN
jgi:hypothetical protein